VKVLGGTSWIRVFCAAGFSTLGPVHTFRTVAELRARKQRLAWGRVPGLVFSLGLASCAGPQSPSPEPREPTTSGDAGEAPSAPELPSSTASFGPAFIDPVKDARTKLETLRVEHGDDVLVSAAQVLEAYAKAFESLPATAEVQQQVEELRFEAERLRRARSAFGVANWLRGGLVAALGALEHVLQARPELASRVATAQSSAKRAVEAIEDDSFVAMQRAVIQDAFRQVSNCFALAILLDSPSKEPPADQTPQSR
jgi:hypothetical protein